MLVLLATGVGVWRWRTRTPATPASGATALSPVEARLLATAARQPRDPQPFRELAEADAGAGRPASALWATAEAAARAPNDPTLRLKQAELLAQLGYVPVAETALRGLAAEPHSGTGAAARQELAELLLATGRPAAALVALRGAGPAAELLRGRAQEAVGEAAAAAAAYRRAGEAGEPEGYERLARVDLASGDLAGAREAMQALAGRRAARPSDLLLVAAIHAAAGTPAELKTALARLRRCLELQPGNAEAHYQAGLLLLRQGDRSAAAEQLEEAVRLDAGLTAARGRLAALYQAMGQGARARQERLIYDELTDQPDRALAEFRRAADEAGSATPPLSRPEALQQAHALVAAAAATGQRAAVVQQIRNDLKRHPGDLEQMLALGMLYREGGSADALKQLCRDWMALQPASGMPYWLLGGQALNENRPAEAIGLFQSACAKEPERADFCTGLGLAYMATGTAENRTPARTWMERAIALDPRTPGPYRQLGQMLEEADDLDAARRCYLCFLDLEPDHADLLNSLVRVLERQQDAETARLFAGLARAVDAAARERLQLAEAVRAHPAQIAPRVQLARFLIRNGQLTAARNQLQRAAETGPADAPARRALAELDRLRRVQARGG